MLGAEGIVLLPGMTLAAIKQENQVKLGVEDLQAVNNLFQL
jgi:hypothetical protein